MKTRFQQSWQLFKTSIHVTFRYPKLLWFPALTTFLTLLIALFFLTAIAVPLALQNTGYRFTQKQHWVTVVERNFPRNNRSEKVRNRYGIFCREPGRSRVSR